MGSGPGLVDLQGGVASEHIEVHVRVQHGDVLADRDGADDAVDELSHGLPPAAAGSVEGRLRLVVGGTGRQHGGSGQQTAELAKVGGVQRSGKDLHANDRTEEHTSELPSIMRIPY